MNKILKISFISIVVFLVVLFAFIRLGFFNFVGCDKCIEFYPCEELDGFCAENLSFDDGYFVIGSGECPEPLSCYEQKSDLS